MRSMWTKIGFGAVGVFLVGMFLLTTFHHARAAVAEAVSETFGPAVLSAASHASRSLSDLPFRLDGHQLGTVNRMVIERTVRNQLMSVKLEVDLDDAADAASLESCDLLPIGDTDANFDQGFRCGAGMDGALIRVGEVRFEPVGMIRPVMVQEAQLDRFSSGEPFRANIDLTHGVHMDATGRDNGRVRVQADSSGAFLRVSDGHGGDLVRITADSNQAFIRIRDKNGKEIFHLQAGKAGLKMSADTPVETP
ncbi:MAG: hypothetical protein ABI587_14415 [Gemmatimonadales bacterium]